MGGALTLPVDNLPRCSSEFQQSYAIGRDTDRDLTAGIEVHRLRLAKFCFMFQLRYLLHCRISGGYHLAVRSLRVSMVLINT